MYFEINITLIIFSMYLVMTGLIDKKENKILKSLYEKVEIIVKNKYKLIIFFLFILTLFTSIYKLGKVPYGIHIDEAGMAYDAISIANYHVDRYLNHFPIYLINYGGGQSAMYAYLTAILIKLFGYSIIIARLPAVLFRLVMFVSILLIMKKQSKLKSIIFLFLFSICPYFIMQSRWGLDCNLLVGFLTISVAVLINSIDKKSKMLFFISGILFGLSLYTYALSYMIIPTLLILTLLYLLAIKKIKISQLILFSIPLAIIAVPLILMILVNNEIIEEIKGFITIPKLPGYRGSEICLDNILNSSYIITNLFSYDNPFPFGTSLIYNSHPYFGTIYYMAIPFFVVGFLQCLKDFKKSVRYKEFDINIIFVFWFFSVLICQLLIKLPNINRANAIFIPILYFITIGIVYVAKNLKSIILPIVLLFIINFTLFFNFYYYHYDTSIDNLWLFATDYLDAVNYAKGLNKKDIYIQNDICASEYMYILLENEISPYDYKTDDITVNYGNSELTYHFHVPSQIDIDSIYIIKNEDIMVEQFREAGFNEKVFDNISVFIH